MAFQVHARSCSWLKIFCVAAIAAALALLNGAAQGQESAVKSPPAAAPKAKLQQKSFDSDGVKIVYVEAGEGEPVILVHGFTASAAMNWISPGIFDALAKDYHVIALDNRGHGKSDKPRDPQAYGANMVEDVRRLLDHLGIQKAHLVGYSMGGFISNKFLADHPDRVLTVTLGGAGWTKEHSETLSMLDELAQSLEDGKGITPLILRLTPEGQPKPSEEQIAAMNSMVMLINDPKALAAVARGMKGLAVTEEQVKANQAPVLALIGEVDPLKTGVDELQGVMPHLEVVVIEKADHMTAFPDPKFLRSLQEFLSKHRAAGVEKPVAAGAGS
ncbi:MAG: alpha/beta hydrolase [Planctomycetaceae bacterium]|nr:alpha/beta hydrolase [Planctomycetaceae bacterium]